MLMVDVSYDFYFDVYNNGAKGIISAERFPLLCRKAKEELDLRLCKEPLDSQLGDVKMALCEIAECLLEAGESSHVRSESTDGYSVTYQNPIPLPSKINSIAQKHLLKHGLLFRGV